MRIRPASPSPSMKLQLYSPAGNENLTSSAPVSNSPMKSAKKPTPRRRESRDYDIDGMPSTVGTSWQRQTASTEDLSMQRTPKPPTENHPSKVSSAAARLARSNSRDSTGSSSSLLQVTVPVAVSANQYGQTATTADVSQGRGNNIPASKAPKRSTSTGSSSGSGPGSRKGREGDMLGTGTGLQIPLALLTNTVGVSQVVPHVVPQVPQLPQALMARMNSLINFGDDGVGAGMVDAEKVKKVVRAQQEHIASLQQAYHSSLQENAALKEHIVELNNRIKAAEMASRDRDREKENEREEEQDTVRLQSKGTSSAKSDEARLSASAAAATRQAATEAVHEFSSSGAVSGMISEQGSATCRQCGQRRKGDMRAWTVEGASLLDGFEVLMTAKQSALDAQHQVIAAQSALMTEVSRRASSELRAMPSMSLSDATVDAIAAATSTSTSTSTPMAAEGPQMDLQLHRQGSSESIPSSSSSSLVCMPIGMDPIIVAAKVALAAQRAASKAAEAEAAALDARIAAEQQQERQEQQEQQEQRRGKAKSDPNPNPDPYPDPAVGSVAGAVGGAKTATARTTITKTPSTAITKTPSTSSMTHDNRSKSPARQQVMSNAISTSTSGSMETPRKKAFDTENNLVADRSAAVAPTSTSTSSLKRGFIRGDVAGESSSGNREANVHKDKRKGKETQNAIYEEEDSDISSGGGSGF